MLSLQLDNGVSHTASACIGVAAGVSRPRCGCRCRLPPARLARRAAAVPVAAVVLALTSVSTAFAHGPVAPNASSYLARVRNAPAGVEAKVVDGDLRLWMRVAPTETVYVLDYRGAPYLRFSASGVAVNRNSEMYYLDHVPIIAPPNDLTASTPPRWERITSAHEYGWHDGRVGALASVVLAPGVSYVGKWSVAVVVDGHRSVIRGGLWRAAPPSIVWLWWIGVMVACALAAWRLRQPELDRLVSRAMAIATVLALAVGAVGKQLHGRPAIGAGQLILLAVALAFFAFLLRRILLGRVGYFLLFVVFICSLMGDFELIPTLLHGYVLIALPASVARGAAVVCAGCGAALLPMTIRRSQAMEPDNEPLPATA